MVTGIGAYSGTAEKTFTIESAKMSDVKVTFAQDTYPATGQPVQPSFTATLGDYTLEEGADYSAAYSNNTAAGKATVTLHSKNGNFEGTKTLEFRINGRPNRIVTGADSYTKYLTSKEFNLDAEAAEAKQLIYTSSNEDVVTVSNIGLVTVKGTGAATITIKTSGTTEYEPAEKTVTVTVKPLKPVVTLTSPQKKQVKVTWTKQEGATKYQVRYGRQDIMVQTAGGRFFY